MSASLRTLTTEQLSAASALTRVVPAGAGNGKTVLRERTELRTETRKVFENTDHTLTYIIHARPIHYRDERGAWQDVDLAWRPSKRAGFDWEMTACGYQAWVCNDLKAQPFLLIKRGAQEWKFRAGKLQWRLGDNVLDVGSLLDPKFARAEGAALVFDTPLPKVSLRLVALPHRLAFQFEIQTGGPVAGLGDNVHLPRLDLELVQLDLAAQTDYYGETPDGYIWGQSSSYATARGTSYNSDAAGTTALVGQYGPGTFYVDRAYLSFDTSGIADDATIASATLYVCADADNSTTDFLIKVYRYAWASALGGSNREPNYDGAYGGSATLEGTLRNTADGWSSGTYYNTAVATAGINKTGTSRYTLVSQEDVDNSQPAGSEYVAIRTADYADQSSDPYIAITIAVNVTVSSPAATVAADALAPTIKTGSKITAAVATVAAVAPVPAVSGAAKVAAAAATVAASAPTPSVHGQRVVVVSAAVATASVAAPAPGVGVGITIAAPAASVAASALTPGVVAHRAVTVVAAVATVAADAPVAAVHGGVVVAAAVAAVAVQAPAPGITIGPMIRPPAATVSAQAPAPTVIAVRNVLIAAEVAAVGVSASTPAVSGAAVVVAAVAAVGVAAPAPAVSGDANIVAAVAGVGVSAPTPSVLAVQNALIAAAVAQVVAAALAPAIVVFYVAYVDVSDAAVTALSVADVTATGCTAADAAVTACVASDAGYGSCSVEDVSVTVLTITDMPGR